MEQLSFPSCSPGDEFGKYGGYMEEMRPVRTEISGQISPKQQRVPGGTESVWRKTHVLCEIFIISHSRSPC